MQLHLFIQCADGGAEQRQISFASIAVFLFLVRQLTQGLSSFDSSKAYYLRKTNGWEILKPIWVKKPLVWLHPQVYPGEPIYRGFFFLYVAIDMISFVKEWYKI